MEEEDDDKWAKQELIEDATMVVADQTTSSTTSTESPTPTSLIPGTASPTRHHSKRARLHSPTAAYPPGATRDPKSHLVKG